MERARNVVFPHDLFVLYGVPGDFSRSGIYNERARDNYKSRTYSFIIIFFLSKSILIKYIQEKVLSGFGVDWWWSQCGEDTEFIILCLKLFCWTSYKQGVDLSKVLTLSICDVLLKY